MELTPRAKTILTTAEAIARESGADKVGAEHIQLALLADTSSVPYQVINAECDAQFLRKKLLEHIDSNGYKQSTNHARFLD